jgi:hypothetical protein
MDLCIHRLGVVDFITDSNQRNAGHGRFKNGIYEYCPPAVSLGFVLL